MDKSLLRAALLLQIEKDLSLQTEAALTSRDEAINEESKPENKYDMHAQEAAYLAEGQARMVAELRETAAQYASMELPAFGARDPIAIGAVVTLQPPKGAPLICFLGPRAGGMEINLNGLNLMVVTPASPLGRQLLGRRQEDTVQVPGRKGPLPHRITDVA